MKKQILSFFIFLAAVTTALSQQIDPPKTYKFKDDVAQGILDTVIYDRESKITQLRFAVIDGGYPRLVLSKAKFRTYYFDEAFNFIRDEEQDGIFKIKKFKGDTRVIDDVYAENDFVGNIILRHSRVTLKWKWKTGSYSYDFQNIERVRLKDDFTAKYTLVQSFQNQKTGELTLIALKKLDRSELIVVHIDYDL